MNKITCLFISAFLLSGGVAFAQGEMDVFRYSQPGLMSGTARYQSMGGAFGALGGDISVMSANPAGLGVYRSSEVVTTLSLSSIKTNSNWNGSMLDGKRTRFNFDNIGYVGYFPTGNDEGLVGWNVGFSYNRVKDFHRSYSLSGNQNFSLADYTADKATFAGIPRKDFTPLLSSTTANNAYNNLPGNWMQGLGYQAGYFEGNSYKPDETSYHSAFGKPNGSGGWTPYMPNETQLNVNESGAIDRYNISFAANVSNIIFLGATIGVTDLNYNMSSTYDEFFGGEDHLYLDNGLSVDGTGYNLNIGAIVRPAEFLRLGVAYNSPTWYKMTDYYYGEAGTAIAGAKDEQGNDISDISGSTPEDVYSKYNLRTPDRWIFSAAGIIGQYALISVDYELSNYKNMHLSDLNGVSSADNKYIEEDFGISNTIRVGAEAKITPQFAVRVGGAWQTSPLKADVKNGNVEILTAGTIPNYTLDKGMAAYSVGLGYRFTPNFYADLTCVYQEYKEDAYVFSKTFEKDKTIVDSDAIGLKTKTTKVALTLGYKF